MGDAPGIERRPAFYAARSGGWRDWWTLLHPPYTAWHLSYVALGAAVAPKLYDGRLLATLLAFFLAVGIGAHALDEYHGHPLRTRLPDRLLLAVGLVGIGAAAGIGLIGAAMLTWWLVPWVAAGVLLAVAYNLELFGGWFHTDAWFALAWGGFPALVGYMANAETIRWPAIAVAAGCVGLSAAQRALSTPARQVRRATRTVGGHLEEEDGTVVPLTLAGLAAPLERALLALSCGVVLLAIGAVAARW